MQWNGGSGRVAVVLDGQDHFVHAQAQVFGGRVDNALVGLVRHNPIDLIGGVTGFFDDVILQFFASILTANLNTPGPSMLM